MWNCLQTEIFTALKYSLKRHLSRNLSRNDNILCFWMDSALILVSDSTKSHGIRSDFIRSDTRFKAFRDHLLFNSGDRVIFGVYVGNVAQVK